MDSERLEVPIEQLRWRCDPKQFGFGCTDELTPLEAFIGQDRAVGAIEFGLGVDQSGYNIYVAGMPGTGRSFIVRAHLERVVREKRERGEAAKPSDWCYLYNFGDPDQPNIIELPAGAGRKFKAALEQLHDDLKREIAGAFSGDEYSSQRKSIVEHGQEVQREHFQRLEQEARTRGFTVQVGPAGVGVFPVQNGRPLTPDEYLGLPEKVRKAFDERRGELSKLVEDTLEQVRDVDQQTGQRVADLDRRVAEFATAGVFSRAARPFADVKEVPEFLEALRSFTVGHIDIFRAGPESRGAQEPGSDVVRSARERQVLIPFVVNVFVDNSEADGPPIIAEHNPTFSNLFGKIDRRFVMGGYLTDHTLLKAGSVSKANGGYLILPIRPLLLNLLSWEALKRVIKTRSVRPEDPAEALGMVVPQSIRPEPMPLNVKVVITGDPHLYSLLASLDEDFLETFKVKADFDSQIERTPEHLDAYSALICRVCERDHLLHLDASGVAKVLEHAARMVADQNKLSTRFGQIKDLLVEADYWARKDGAKRVAASHVDKALEQKIFRSNLIAEHIRELIRDGTFMVDVAGAVAGQANGLAVVDIGDFSFGRPSRITARTFLGRGGVINIEREARLSGRTYDKGVLILSGYLSAKYAQRTPLSVSVSIAFEQSYEGVEGDSASSTELYAVLSSLAEAPIKQGIAVTGSVNQRGEVQAIGGVNQKIEGFFDVCTAIGLTGEQGVLIPKQNVRNLMLREDVVEAVREGRFHVYAVGAIDKGIEILTGLPFGERGPDGAYPEGSINARVEERLREYARIQREYIRGPDGAGERQEPQEKPEPAS